MKLLFVSLLLCANMHVFSIHPMNISSTKIIVVGNKATLTVSFGYTDFYFAVKDLTHKDLVVKNETFTDESKTLVEAYWNENFKIWIEGKPVKMVMKQSKIYAQEDGSTVELEFELPRFGVFGKKLKIHNSLLLNVVSVQKNIVHIYAKDNKLLTVQLFSKGEVDKETKL